MGKEQVAATLDSDDKVKFIELCEKNRRSQAYIISELILHWIKEQEVEE